jgi:hypothetical protein
MVREISGFKEEGTPTESRELKRSHIFRLISLIDHFYLIYLAKFI